jgi:hypothetical protein
MLASVRTVEKEWGEYVLDTGGVVDKENTMRFISDMTLRGCVENVIKDLERILEEET